VDEQDLVDAGHVAVAVGQLRLVGDAHDRAHRVEEARQQHGEDEQHAGQHADLGETAEQADLADQPEVGAGHRVAGPGRVGQAPGGDVGHGVDDHRDDRHGDDGQQDRAGHLAHDQREREQRAEDEDQHRPAVQVTADAQLARDGGLGGVRDAGDEAGVDQADQHDEQADTDDDGLAQDEGDGVHHAFPQHGGDQQHDHEAGQHDHAHGVRPGHPGRELERDDRVDAEPGRERDRHVADDAHQQGGERGGQGGRGDQLTV